MNDPDAHAAADICRTDLSLQKLRPVGKETASLKNQKAARMLERYEIGSFRKLSDLHLKDLGQFSLIVGKNNSGKTSILEAIAVGLAMGDGRQILSVARQRDSRSNVVMAGASYLSDIVWWMFPAAETSFWDVEFSGSISLHFDIGGVSYRTEMGCRRVLHEAETRQHDFLSKHDFEPLRGLEVTTNVFEKRPLDRDFEQVANETFSLGQRSAERETIYGRRSQNSIPFEYISPYSHRNSNSSENYVKRLESDQEKKTLVSLLQSIDSDIVDINYEPFLGSEKRRPRGGRAVVTTRNGKFIPLSVMGDGFRRICELGFALHFSKNGILLIDEIEAGFHIGMLERVYRWLTRQARENRVQIIASSHSLEAIQAMADATPAESREQNLRAYSIGLDRPFGRIRSYYGDELHSLISENGLDIR